MKYFIETYGCQMNVHDSERMAGLLEQAGYEPMTASDGAQALELLARHPQDLIITDLKMPGMSGLDLLKQIRAGYAEILVIDEASTLSDRDLDRLMAMTAAAGASMRLIGDPAQHGGRVPAGTGRLQGHRHGVRRGPPSPSGAASCVKCSTESWPPPGRAGTSRRWSRTT